MGLGSLGALDRVMSWFRVKPECWVLNQVLEACGPCERARRCRIMEAVSLGALVVTERGVDPTLDALWADKVLTATHHI